MPRPALILALGVALCVAVCVAMPPVASAESFRDRLRAGYDQLEGGQTDAAVATFRDLQVDRPESEVVAYSLASAKYKQGLLDIANEAPDDAILRLTEAKTAFDELYTSADPFIRFNAHYNAANCAAQIAKSSMETGDHEATVEAFEQSILAYEYLSEDRPDHVGARTNLNHMRYLLKTLLQNPPPEEEQEPGEGDDQDEDESGEDGGEEEQQSDQQPGEASDDDQEDEDAKTDPNNIQSAAEEQPEEEAEPLNRQNIEAILQSLEDQDREEQKNLRRSKEPPRVVNRKWW